MAFNKDNLQLIGANQYEYQTQDDKSTVTSIGYFNPAYVTFSVDDEIRVINNSGEFNLRVSAVGVNSVTVKTTGFISEVPLTAFDEMMTAELTPLIQITGQYGVRDDVFTATLGGTVISSNSNIIASTGTGASNVAAALSFEEGQYRAGQGLQARFSMFFTTGVANSTQIAGMIQSESTFAFGYNGTEFGIVHGFGGGLEYQELQITTAATGAENATITIDGTAHSIALTAGTVQHNAYEIAKGLQAVEPRYNFTSTDDTVTCLAKLTDFGAGAFSFSSATAAGSFTQIAARQSQTENWTKQADWNGEAVTIDPTKGNVGYISFPYLGYGDIFFFLKDPETGRAAMVHRVKYLNQNTTPSVSNPTFRVGWAARNSGNTTNLQVGGASAALFTEGAHIFDSFQHGKSVTLNTASTIPTNVLAFRGRLGYQAKANRSNIKMLLFSFATETARIATFEIWKNPVLLSGSLNYQYEDSVNDLMETATDAVDIDTANSQLVGAFQVVKETPLLIDATNVLEFLIPNVEYSITVFFSGGGAADNKVSINWRDTL